MIELNGLKRIAKIAALADEQETTRTYDPVDKTVANIDFLNMILGYDEMNSYLELLRLQHESVSYYPKSWARLCSKIKRTESPHFMIHPRESKVQVWKRTPERALYVPAEEEELKYLYSLRYHADLIESFGRESYSGLVYWLEQSGNRVLQTTLNR